MSYSFWKYNIKQHLSGRSFEITVKSRLIGSQLSAIFVIQNFNYSVH